MMLRNSPRKIKIPETQTNTNTELTYEEAFKEIASLNPNDFRLIQNSLQQIPLMAKFEDRFRFFQDTDFSAYPILKKYQKISEALKKLPKDFNSFTTISSIPESVTKINVNEEDPYKSAFRTIAAEILQNQRNFDIQEKDINQILSQCKSKLLA